MVVLCIAGSGTGAGKTAVGCELIRAMPELRWLAVKISPHVHEISDGITEETDASSAKDTGRYLTAGAKRAFLITTEGDALELVLRVRKQAAECDAVLIESGRFRAEELIELGNAILTLAVLAGGVSKWKPETLERARGADALVLAKGTDQHSLPEELRQRRFFALREGEWQNAAMIDFVRERLRLATWRRA